MKIIKSFFYWVLLFLIITSCKNKVNKKQNLKSKNAGETTKIKNLKSPCLKKVRPKLKSTYPILEQLSKHERDSIVNKNRSLLNKIVLYHYDNYSDIQDLDSLSEILSNCETNNPKLAPFYLYVVNQLSENSDGYLGEAVNDFYFTYFIKFPQIVYPYLFYKKDKNENDYKGLLYQILFDINGEEYSNEYLDSIFNKHKELCPKLTSEIDSVSTFILSNKSY